jgi:eukaryotic-like serine/threonine-protein kinase
MVRRYSRFTSLAVSGCLLVLLAACGPFGSADAGPTPTASTSGATAIPTTRGATSTPTTAPMPATQTACPGAGARAAVFAPLVLGSHQNIVYLFNQGGTSGSAEIKRYDASTGKKVIIVDVPNINIPYAQISPDGQWVLFTTPAGMAGERALQLVRMDGQGLQTLYCADNLGGFEWSPDQKTVVFTVGDQIGNSAVDLFDLATGHLQVELVEPATAGIGAIPVTWLDETHIAMKSVVRGRIDGPPPQSLSVLDTAKGAHQQLSDLIKVFDSSGPCLSFDSSVDQAQLFVSTCHVTGGPGVSPTQQGPSTIIAEPALGGPQTTVYTTPTLAITTVRVISRTTLLLLIQNLTGDTSHNGLWKMNLDGTGLTRLTTAGTGQGYYLNATSQFPWSNVSRDGRLYALEIGSGSAPTQALLIGSLTGAGASPFATVSITVGSVEIVGWTTM